MAEIIAFPHTAFTAPLFESGTVLSERSEGYEVMIAGGPVTAKTCASCLMKPSVGDEVVLVILKEKALILAISEARTEKNTLQFGEEVEIQAGKLNIESKTFHLETTHHSLEAQSSHERLSQLKNIVAPVIREQADRVSIQAEQIALN